MTFDEIVNRVAGRLNLTSPVAIARIGESVNERYQRATASVGLNASARTIVTGIATIGSAYITFTGLERLDMVYDGTANPIRHLREVTMDELLYVTIQTGSSPQLFAVSTIGEGAVAIRTEVEAATAFVLGAIGDGTVTTLSGAGTPNFPSKFHDLLVYGAMASELEHMEKYDMAGRQEQKWEVMLSQLRLYLASNAYLDIRQGKNSPDSYDGMRWLNP